MKTTYKIKAPDDIEATVTVTATVGELRKVQELLKQNPSHWHWPLAGFTKGVGQAIAAADAHFTNSQENEVQV